MERRREITPEAEVETAIHTVLHEVGTDVHHDDVLDAVYGMVGHDTYQAVGEVEVGKMIARFI